MKKILLIILVLILLIFAGFFFFKKENKGLVLGATSGPNSGATFTTDSSNGGTIDWTNPGNAASSDDSRATAVLSVGDVSFYLVATGFNFSIPAGSTINGITVEWEKSVNLNNSAMKDSAIRIVKGGAIGATDKSNANFWTTTDTYISYGGVSDLWGETWTPADINASTFGAALAAFYVPVSSGKTAQIDHVRITVTYTEAAATTPTSQMQVIWID